MKRRPSPAATAAALIPASADLAELRRRADGCTACELYRRATRTVFGAGPSQARVMLVGEQPGNEEDLTGKPFVGPAGRVLGAALGRAGIDRGETYVTNIVKHFKWEPRGKRRIHAKPSASEVAACRPWLEAELARIRPEILVALGATAAQGLLGRGVRVRAQRGQFLSSPLAPRVMVTVHPSAILRSRDDAERHREMEHFVRDLRGVAAALHSTGNRSRSSSRLPSPTCPRTSFRSRETGRTAPSREGPTATARPRVRGPGPPRR